MKQVTNPTLVEQIKREGFALVPDVYSEQECEQLIVGLNEHAMEADQNPLRSSRGSVYAARNLIDSWPAVKQCWKRPQLTDLLVNLLGPTCGLVRVLFFDKPPERSWSLPFHKDMTIAVADNSLPSVQLTKPTTKCGIDHVEASEEVLASMLTLRIHLDPIDGDNGPLQVIPGSHASGKRIESTDCSPVSVHSAAGDVLAMRPLLSHASGHSSHDSLAHRRILHLEFASAAELPDGFQWNWFER